MTGNEWNDTIGRLVRVAFLVRILALLLAVGTMSYHGARTGTWVLFALLALTSHLGLQYRRARDLVVRHPMLAVPDLILVASVPVLVGLDSPLNLVSLSSMFLVGVLFVLRTAIPLGALVVLVHLMASVREDQAWSISAGLSGPVALVSFTAVGMAVRRMGERQREAEQQSIRAQADAAAARERLKLARDLHDSVAKTVQGVALTAAALPAWIRRDPDVAQRQAERIVQAAHEAMRSARELMGSLRLDDPSRPLHEVFDQLVHRWEAEHSTTAQTDLRPVCHLPAERRHELLLAVREALENTARHAPGAHVRVTLKATEREVTATVEDDGPGFDARRREEAVRSGHYGLVGMAERLSGIGGSAEVVTVVGRGTSVVLRVPTRQQQDHLQHSATGGPVVNVGGHVPLLEGGGTR